jgi:16S rRNA (guanine1516-N2)-methyltransferase
MKPLTGGCQISGAAVVCTTPHRVTRETVQRAQRAAEWFSCRVVPRRKRSLQQIVEDEGASIVLVADEPLYLVMAGQLNSPLFFHPGMAYPRIAQLRKGQRDRLVELAQIRPGDFVIDATFGLGSDSLVFAEAVGEGGRVLGIESSPWLARLFTYAKTFERHLYPAIDDILDRIDVEVGDHVDRLRQLPDNGAAVVYFDPMFRSPLRNADSSIEPARALTNAAPLSDDAWREAMRVAKRCVILKERPGSGEFERFGVSPDKKHAKFAFGVWRKETGNAER